MAKFSKFDDLIADQGDVAIVIEMDPDTHGHFYSVAAVRLTVNRLPVTAISRMRQLT